jgi:hypothetical protein
MDTVLSTLVNPDVFSLTVDLGVLLSSVIKPAAHPLKKFKNSLWLPFYFFRKAL